MPTRRSRARIATDIAGLECASYGSYLLADGDSAADAIARVLDTARRSGRTARPGLDPVRRRAGITAHPRGRRRARGDEHAAAAERDLTVGLEFHGGTLTATAASTTALLDAVDAHEPHRPTGSRRTGWRPAPAAMTPPRWKGSARASRTCTSTNGRAPEDRRPLAEGAARWRSVLGLPPRRPRPVRPAPRVAFLEFVAGDDPAHAPAGRADAAPAAGGAVMTEVHPTDPAAPDDHRDVRGAAAVHRRRRDRLARIRGAPRAHDRGRARSPRSTWTPGFGPVLDAVRTHPDPRHRGRAGHRASGWPVRTSSTHPAPRCDADAYARGVRRDRRARRAPDPVPVARPRDAGRRRARRARTSGSRAGVDRLLGFELGPMFHPAGRIFSLDVFRRLLDDPGRDRAQALVARPGPGVGTARDPRRAPPGLPPAHRQRPRDRHGRVRLRLPARPLDVRARTRSRRGTGRGRPATSPASGRSTTCCSTSASSRSAPRCPGYRHDAAMFLVAARLDRQRPHPPDLADPTGLRPAAPRRHRRPPRHLLAGT